MRLVVLLVSFFLFAPSLKAASFENEASAAALIDKTMKQVSTGDLRGGLALLKPYVIVPEAEFDAMIGQAELQMPVMTARFGKNIGYEFLRNDTVGESLVQLVYLQRFEKHATVWRFVLYRGSNGWVINTFKYADDIASAF